MNAVFLGFDHRSVKPFALQTSQNVIPGNAKQKVVQ
jgi:hypothetical protein